MTAPEVVRRGTFFVRQPSEKCAAAVLSGVDRPTNEHPHIFNVCGAQLPHKIKKRISSSVFKGERQIRTTAHRFYINFLKAVKYTFCIPSIYVVRKSCAVVRLDFLTSRGGRWKGQIKSLVADMFQGEAMDDGERARIEKRFGRMLAQYRGEFSVCFPGYEVVKRRGVTTHVFRGIDDRLNEMNRGDAT